MIALALFLVARAETPVDLEARLLGEGSTPMVASVEPATPGGLRWFGALGALGLLGVGVWTWRRDLTGPAESGSVRVVGKRQTAVGPVVLLDIDGLDGTTHRLLVAGGSAGAHVLADVTLGLASLEDA